jgi:hypothetical protein
MKHEPYSLHEIHRVTAAEDDIFTDQHGDLSVANLQPMPSGEVSASFRADLIAYVDPTATPAATRRMRGPGGRASGILQADRRKALRVPADGPSLGTTMRSGEK